MLVPTLREKHCHGPQFTEEENELQRQNDLRQTTNLCLTPEPELLTPELSCLPSLLRPWLSPLFPAWAPGYINSEGQ